MENVFETVSPAELIKQKLARGKEIAEEERNRKIEIRNAAKAEKKAENERKKEERRLERAKLRAENRNGQNVSNGIPYPAEGTKGFDNWAMFDTLTELNGRMATIQESLLIARADGKNFATVRRDHHRWQIFHGYRPPVESKE